ncbi:MAG: porin [Rhodocyclaceae bacterium]|nr:porin [Rhodocyclaceae bacterium]
MQKKLIALAIAGLSSAAFAQSNVTISGQMKVGFADVSAKGATVAGASLTSRARVEDNNSNIRFSGEENLGGGMAAFFQVESAIGTSDNIGTTGAQGAGATSTGIGTRNTAVGLKGGWGMALMGKWDAYYNSVAGVDGMGLADGHGLATSSLSILHTNGNGNGFGGRLNNVVAYATPNFSGFDALIAYSATIGANANEDTRANMAGKEKGWYFNPKYTNGPIHVFFAHLRANNVGAIPVTPAAGDSGVNVRANRLGAAYTFPMGLKIGLVWDKNKVEVADGNNVLAALGVAATGGNVGVHSRRERTAWALPIQYTTGAHKVNFTYAWAGNLKTNALGVNSTLGDSKARMWTLGYEYALSKRTSVAASYLAINNGQNGRYDGWHPSSSVSGSQAVAGALPYGADPRVLQFNVRHAF